MAGGRRTYVHNFNLNALNLYGLPVASAGHSLEPKGDDIRVFQEEKGNEYRKIVLKSGVLIGFILIGDTSRAGLFLSRMKRGDIIENPAELFTRIQSCAIRIAAQHGLPSRLPLAVMQGRRLSVNP